MKNKKEIRIIAQKRSGQHAIIFWIISQVKGPVCYINNLFSVEKYKKKEILKKISHGYKYGSEKWYFYNMNADQVKKENLFSIKNKELFISNVEEQKIKNIIKRIENLSIYTKGNSEEIFNVLILRDPYNLLASKLKRRRRIRYNSILNWINYAKEYLDITSYLGKNKIIINYNKWVVNKEYRKKILLQLGLDSENIDFTNIPTFGGGSSFSGTKYDGKADRMDVFKRWESFKNNKQYLSMVKYKSLQMLSEVIFGETPNDLKFENISGSISISYIRFINILFQTFLTLLNLFFIDKISKKYKNISKFYKSILNLLKKRI